MTWGFEDAFSSDISDVQDRLQGVTKIQSTFDAFAAILSDGSVVAWGDPGHGGDCAAVQGRLVQVKDIQATCSAFAAILADGSVVTWGHPQHGGDSAAVQDQLRGHTATTTCCEHHLRNLSSQDIVTMVMNMSFHVYA